MPIRAGSTPVVLKSGRRSAFKVGGQGLTVAATPFAPTDISGLIAWYSFDDISTMWKDTARTSAVTADADTIKGVTDKSGTGNHLSEATNGPAYKTAVQNGLSVSRYVVASSTRLASGTFAAVAQPLTAFVVGSQTGGGNQFWLDGPTTNRISIWKDVTKESMYAGTILDGGVADTSWHQYSALFNGGSSQLWRDGSSRASGAAGAFQPTGFRLGSDATPTNFLGGDIGEVLVYSASLSAGNRGLVETYLKSRWGTP